MATRNEKIVGVVIGGLVGAFLGNEYAKKKDIPEIERWKYQLIGIVGGILGGRILASLLGSPNDTINYKLVNGKKTVYHGITFQHRVSQRELEHKASGKAFTKMIVDIAKPRVEALELEKMLIKTYKPIYNIQHNNG